MGDGQNHWQAVHRFNVAKVYCLVLEHGTTGESYQAVGDEGIPFKEIAETIGKRLNVPTVSLKPNEAMEHFGFLEQIDGLDNPASSELTKQRLHWQPMHPSLLADLKAEHYFKYI